MKIMLLSSTKVKNWSSVNLIDAIAIEGFSKWLLLIVAFVDIQIDSYVVINFFGLLLQIQ